MTANAKSIVRMINARTGAVYQKLKMEHEVRAMAFGSGGKFLILGTRVGTLHSLDVLDSKQHDGTYSCELSFRIPKFKLSSGGVTCIKIVPPTETQQMKLLVNTMDSNVAILGCSLDSEKRATNIQVLHRAKVVHTVLPLQCCYSPTGDGYVISGSEDNRAYIYSLSDYKLQQLRKHSGAVVAVGINSTNTTLATADSNGIIVLWRRYGYDTEARASRRSVSGPIGT